MDLVATVRKSGSRGGVNFSWDEVATSAHRENYLGHSLKAPVGRWQQGKDLQWYAKADAGNADPNETDEDRQARIRREEIQKIKEAEEDAIAKALGLPPPVRNTSGANAIEVLGSRMGGEASPAPERPQGVQRGNRTESHRSRRREDRDERHREGRDREHRHRHRHRSRSRDRHGERGNRDGDDKLEPRSRRDHRGHRSKSRSPDRDRHRRHRRHGRSRSRTPNREYRRRSRDRDGKGRRDEHRHGSPDRRSSLSPENRHRRRESP